MAKYIKCDNCGKRIDLGSEVYYYSGYCGLYCSAECFADSYAEVTELDEDVAENCMHTVYDDDVIKQTIVKLQKEILEKQNELAKLLKETGQ